MRHAELWFWCCAALVGYAYVGYPAILAAVAWLRQRPVRRAPFEGSVSIVLIARNEAKRIVRRRNELTAMLDDLGLEGELLIVSDGSDDGTAEVARCGAGDRVRVIEFTENVGKAAALSHACGEACGEVLVFADARQHWAPDALRRLLENFADPGVGAVSGDLCLAPGSGPTSGVGLYWRYEKGVRKLESRAHSMVGVTGAISAVRRRLFCPIPPGTILDDVYWPMRVAMRGARVVHDETALAFDRLPEEPRDEFRRKVRTLSGNYQLVARLPAALIPGSCPIWFQFLSHKVLRLLVPWLLIAMLVISGRLPGTYRFVFAVQAMGYLLALAGLNRWIAARFRLASSAAGFLLLNAAAWTAFWVYAFGWAEKSWRKIDYDHAPRQPFPAAAQARQGWHASAPKAANVGKAMVWLVALSLMDGSTNTLHADPAAANPSRQTAKGDIYYVAENGNDSNPGSENAPFRTLQRAANWARAGDTVHVRAGTYAGMNLHSGKGGSPDRPIRFLADKGVLINTSATEGPNADSGINLEPGQGWYVFAGFHIVNGDGSMGRACVRITGNSHTQLLDMVCEKGGNWGIFSSQSDDLLIQGNTCRDSHDQHGIYVSRGAKRAIVRGNTLCGNHWDGLHLNGGKEGPIDRCVIEGNIIRDNELSGIDADGVQNSVFQNNLVYGNQKHAVTLYNNDSATGCNGNLFVNNTFVSRQMFAVQMKAGSTGNSFFNNILLHTGLPSRYGSIGVSDVPADLTSDYNVVSDHFSMNLGASQIPFANWQCQTGQEAHSIVAEAKDLFVNPARGDYHLKAASAAVDAGSTAAGSSKPPATDIEGTPRPQGIGIDIGAYERKAVGPTAR